MVLQTSVLDCVLRVAPAKNWLSQSSNLLILRTPWVNVRSSSSSLPILSQKIFPTPLRASTPPKYVYPDPIPEFAEAETRKFRVELLRKLSKEKDTFGDDLHAVVAVCVQIFSEFLLKEYGGPGTLLVEPFTDMLVALKEKQLPGAPLAARTSLLWAQNYVDQDWQIWNSKPKPPKFVVVHCSFHRQENQLEASEMLCNEGRHDFDLAAAAEVIDAVLGGLSPFYHTRI